VHIVKQGDLAMIAGGVAEGTEEDRIHMAILLRDIKAQTNAMFQLESRQPKMGSSAIQKHSLSQSMTEHEDAAQEQK
jgi:hypothetical protein